MHKRKLMASSRKHSCHGNTKLRSLVIKVRTYLRTYVAVRIVIIVESLEMRAQQCALYNFSLQILLQEI